MGTRADATPHQRLTFDCLSEVLRSRHELTAVMHTACSVAMETKLSAVVGGRLLRGLANNRGPGVMSAAITLSAPARILLSL